MHSSSRPSHPHNVGMEQVGFSPTKVRPTKNPLQGGLPHLVCVLSCIWMAPSSFSIFAFWCVRVGDRLTCMAEKLIHLFSGVCGWVIG